MSECKHNYVLTLDMMKRQCTNCKQYEPKTLSEKIIQKYAKYDIHVQAIWSKEEANACVFNLASALDKLEKENERLKADLEKHKESEAMRIRELEKENKELKAEAKRLWSLLDDISTYGDMYKPERTSYVKAVDKKCDEREGLIYSDGYKLYIKEQSE